MDGWRGDLVPRSRLWALGVREALLMDPNLKAVAFALCICAVIFFALAVGAKPGCM